MTPHDHLRAAARCWERAGFYEYAAERFTASEAWHDAGRCSSQAERHSDAALAYSRASEPLLEAREHLKASWPERARSLFERLRWAPFLSPTARVEVLLGLDEIEEAKRNAFTSGDHEATATLARLTSARGRPDLATAWRPEEDLAPWNRSLPWLLLPAVAGAAKVGPSVEFSEVALVPIWNERTRNFMSGDCALDCAADSKCFAAALNTDGIARIWVGPEAVRVERWQFPTYSRCVRFLPEGHAVLIGHLSGEVRQVNENGTVELLESLRMPGHVSGITFTPQGDRLALSASTDLGSLLKLWTWRGGQAQFQLQLLVEGDHFVHAGDCHPVTAWSPDGRRLAWSPGFYRKPHRLFLAGQEIPHGHETLISSLAFTTDGRFIVTSAGDKTVVVRDGVSGQIIDPPERFGQWVNCASLHPKAPLVAVAEGQLLHLLRLDETLQFSRLAEKSLDENIYSLTFSRDARHLLVMTMFHLHLFRVDLKP